MNIELLNVRIYIQKNEVISDAIGNRKNAWKDYYTCYATVSAEAGKESTDAGLVVDDSKIDFTIRYCKKAAALTSTGYRVQFESELYDILAVDHMNFKRKCIYRRKVSIFGQFLHNSFGETVNFYFLGHVTASLSDRRV